MYIAHLKKKKSEPVKYTIERNLSIGLDPRNDIVLTEKKILTKHLLLEMKEDVLVLRYYGDSNTTHLSNIPLQQNRSYIVDDGDVIKFKESTIEIEKINFNSATIEKAEKSEEPEKRPEEKQKIPASPTMKKRIPPKPMQNNTILMRNVAKALEGKKAARASNAKSIAKGERTKYNFKLVFIPKIMAIVFDFMSTYFLLTTVAPLLGLEEHINQFATMISSYLELQQTYAILNFVILWYLLSFAQTSIFGTTFGQFFVGLKMSYRENSFFSFALGRLKTFLYSFFLIPAQNDLSRNTFFAITRRILYLPIVLVFLSAPLIFSLKHSDEPQFLSVAPAKSRAGEITYLYASSSSETGLELNAQVPVSFLFLPLVGEALQSGLEYREIKSDKKMTLNFIQRYPLDKLQKISSHANPLADLLYGIHPTPLKIKELLIASLLISPQNMERVFYAYGPFFGGSSAFKSFLMNHDERATTVQDFGENSPAFSYQVRNDTFYVILTNTEMLKFKLNEKESNPRAVNQWEKNILSPLSLKQKAHDLEAEFIEFFTSYDLSTPEGRESLLTYYINLANKLQNPSSFTSDLEVHNEIQKSLAEHLELAAENMKNQKVKENLKSIIYQLTPMETPGGNDE